MQARDIMIKDMIVASPDSSLQEIAKLMVENEISGVPVVDGEQLLGIVTENDLLMRAKKLDLPTFLPFIGGVIYLEAPGKLDKEIEKATATKASEIMTSDVHTISPDKSVTEIATLMVEENVNRLPVVEDGKLLGLITRSDVVKAVAAELE